MHLDALTAKGKKIFPELKKITGFYLAGGTALALQIGHRISVDFDLFTDRKIKPGLLKNVEKVFSAYQIKPLINNSSELTVLVDDVKLTFLHYPFLNIKKTVTLKGLPVMNMKDIAATKAYAIGRRGTLKDYIDLYYLFFEKHADINETIKNSQKKYGHEFNARLFAEQLIYFDDIEDEAIVFLKKKIDKEKLNDFFSKEIKKIKF